MTDEKLPEVSRNRVSRRTVLKLTGAGAAIAWTTPIISSVRMPAFAASGCTEVVFQDDFEQETCGTLNSSLANWSINPGGSVDIVGGACSPQFGITTPSNAVDLDGTVPGGCSSTPTIITSNWSAALPGSYQLEFELGGSQRGDAPNTVLVTLGSFAQAIPLASGAPLATQGPFSVNLSGGEQLQFQHTNGDCIGLLLDNVVVRFCG